MPKERGDGSKSLFSGFPQTQNSFSMERTLRTFKKETSMTIQDMIRAWRDSTYRESLTEEQRALLLEHPLGEALSEEELEFVSGGVDTGTFECAKTQICPTR
jgi:mersacidin/lichenicidin family type 2 lantibiotic